MLSTLNSPAHTWPFIMYNNSSPSNAHLSFPPKIRETSVIVYYVTGDKQQELSNYTQNPGKSSNTVTVSSLTCNGIFWRNSGLVVREIRDDFQKCRNIVGMVHP